jgi:hypothetical protein
MKESAEAEAMSRRRRIDWRREWDLEQIEAEEEQKRGKDPGGDAYRRRHGDWRHVPTEFIRREVEEGHHHLYVVQTCRWREEFDECADWSPEDGRSILAFDNFSQAQRYAKQHQDEVKERMGVVEVVATELPRDELHLVKQDGCFARRRPEREGRVVAGFADRFDAEQHALDRERADWKGICDRAGFFTLEWTTLPWELLGDVFLDLNVPPPPPASAGNEALWDWWKQTAPLMDGWQRERLRLALDRFSRYRVVAVPFSP